MTSASWASAGWQLGTTSSTEPCRTPSMAALDACSSFQLRCPDSEPMRRISCHRLPGVWENQVDRALCVAVPSGPAAGTRMIVV